MGEVHQYARIRDFKKQTFFNARYLRIFCVTIEWIRKMNKMTKLQPMPMFRVQLDTIVLITIFLRAPLTA